MYRVLVNNRDSKIVDMVNEVPSAIAVSDDEIIVINGNIESIALLDEEEDGLGIGITAKSGHFYGIETDNKEQIYQKETLTKDERFKLEQPEKYGRLVDENIEITEVEESEDE